MPNYNEIEVRNREAAWIVHRASIASAIAAAAFAQSAWFGFATALLTPITVWMIVSIGSLFGRKYEESALWGVFGVTLGAAGVVVLANAVFFGLFPIAGNLINAGITLGVTETLGWVAYRAFGGGKHVIKGGDDRTFQTSQRRGKSLSSQREKVSLRG